MSNTTHKAQRGPGRAGYAKPRSMRVTDKTWRAWQREAKKRKLTVTDLIHASVAEMIG